MMATKLCFQGVARASRIFLPWRLASTSRLYASSASGQSSAREQENRRLRVELAGAYRTVDRLGLNEGICNHMTMVAPRAGGEGNVMLLVPFGLHWCEVTASSLLGIDDAGNVVEGDGEPEQTAFCIHRGLRHGHNHKCVMHIHSPYATALACLKDPSILPCHQTALRFHGKISYDREFGGFGDTTEEGRRLGDQLGPDSDVLIMGNHGILTVGDTIGWAFDTLYYIERLCMIQVLAMSTGRELSLMPSALFEQSKNYGAIFPKLAEGHFQSHLRLLHKESPEFAQ